MRRGLGKRWERLSWGMLCLWGLTALYAFIHTQ